MKNNRLTVLHERITTLQAVPITSRSSFDPKRTFLWLALFSETIQQLNTINLNNPQEVIASDPLFDMFIQWHTDSTLAESNDRASLKEPGEFNGGKVKMAMTMNASDLLSLSLSYWNMVQVKLSLRHLNAPDAIDHIEKVIRCGIAFICDKGTSVGFNSIMLFEFIFEPATMQTRINCKNTLDKVICSKKLTINGRKLLVSLAQIVKSLALFTGEFNALIGIQYQLMTLLLLSKAVSSKIPDGSIEEILESCKKEDGIIINISEMYSLLIENFTILNDHISAVELSLEHIDVLNTRFKRNVNVGDIESMYIAQASLGRSFYVLGDFTRSLELHQASLLTLTSTLLKMRPSFLRDAYFNVANGLSTMKKYREALAYIRAASHYVKDNNQSHDDCEVNILFLLGCTEYRCGLELDSTSTPSHTAVLELLQNAHDSLTKALSLTNIDLKENITIQLCVLLCDLQRFDEADEIMRQNNVTKQCLDSCEKGKTCNGVIWSETVWSILMKLAIDDNDIIDKSMNV